MQWFDVALTAELFGVERHTVYYWVRTGKLSAVRRLVPTEPLSSDSSTRTRFTRKLYIPRVDLEIFLVRYWNAKTTGRKPITVEHLMRAGQETGALPPVRVEDELSPDSDHATQSARVHKTLRALNLRHRRLPITYATRRLATRNDDSKLKWRAPVQLELPLVYRA